MRKNKADRKCGDGEASYTQYGPAQSRLFPHSPRRRQLLRQRRIAELFREEVHYEETDAVFYLTFTEVMQVRLPVRVLLEIFGRMFGQQNVPGVTAVHHPLGRVDTATSHICLAVYIHHSADRTAVYAHAQA